MEIATYILIFAVLLVLELLYFKIADKFNIIDKPNERSSHSEITLRGGGIIFPIGYIIYFMLYNFQYPYFAFGLVFISLISFADDIKPKDFKIRLLIQFISIFLMLYQISSFTFSWYILLMLVILVAGIINAFNFMDGINGITGLYSFVILLSLFYINLFVVDFVDNNMIIIGLISLLVFGIFNFRKKAKCFAGDVGAVAIAFTVAFLLGKLIFISHNFTYIAILSVYGTDSLLTILRRLILKENITKPHRKHLYQLLANELGISHLKISVVYAILQLIIIVGLIIFEKNSIIYTFSIFALLAIVYFVLIRLFNSVRAN